MPTMGGIALPAYSRCQVFGDFAERGVRCQVFGVFIAERDARCRVFGDFIAELGAGAPMPTMRGIALPAYSRCRVFGDFIAERGAGAPMPAMRGIALPAYSRCRVFGDFIAELGARCRVFGDFIAELGAGAPMPAMGGIALPAYSRCQVFGDFAELGARCQVFGVFIAERDARCRVFGDFIAERWGPAPPCLPWVASPFLRTAVVRFSAILSPNGGPVVRFSAILSPNGGAGAPMPAMGGIALPAYSRCRVFGDFIAEQGPVVASWARWCHVSLENWSLYGPFIHQFRKQQAADRVSIHSQGPFQNRRRRSMRS